MSCMQDSASSSSPPKKKAPGAKGKGKPKAAVSKTEDVSEEPSSDVSIPLNSLSWNTRLLCH